MKNSKLNIFCFVFWICVCNLDIFFRFLKSIDVVELGGSDELCGKGYELSLFLFSDVLEISKKKSSSKGLGIRSPSTMSLRNVGAGASGTLTNNGKYTCPIPQKVV